MLPRSRACLVGVCLGASCSPAGPEVAFEVEGFIELPLTEQGSMIGLWKTASGYYKFGDGITLGSQFTIGFDYDPPEAAIGTGFGVAILAMLPRLTTVPDGPVDTTMVAILGITSDHAVIYKDAFAIAPPWSDPFPLRFTCAACVRSTTGLDSFEQAPCAAMLVKDRATPVCNWK